MRATALSCLLLGVLVGSPAAARRGRGSGAPHERAAAARRAGERGDRGAIPRLIPLLSDRSAEVRAAAATALGKLRARAALRQLMVRARVDPDGRVRRAAAAALRAIDARAFVASAASADPPPVAPLPRPPLRPRARRAALFTLGLQANALRFDESFGGSAGVALRWLRSLEVELVLGYPAISLAARMRLLLLSYPRLTPFVTAGVAVSFNNGMEGADRAAVSLTGGVGLRWYIIPPIFVQAELLVAWVAKQARPVIQGDDALDERAFAVPVLLSAGLELWP